MKFQSTDTTSSFILHFCGSLQFAVQGCQVWFCACVNLVTIERYCTDSTARKGKIMSSSTATATATVQRKIPTTEVIVNTSRNVNKILQSCNAMEKNIKEQSLSIKAVQEEIAQMKSALKSKQRNKYSLKRAGHEVKLLLIFY